jgi:prephenate dehydrogenase
VSDTPLFGKVVVFGVGLIGGSFALALKAAGQAGEVVGFGRRLGSLTQALATRHSRPRRFQCRAGGVGRRPGADRHAGRHDPEIMARVAPCLGPQTVVTDAGSTKEDVVAAARLHFAGGSGSSFPRIPSPAPKTVVHSRRGPISIARSRWC